MKLQSAIVTLFFLATIANAWTFDANYTSAVNFRVLNWSYVQNGDVLAKAQYVLVRLPPSISSGMPFIKGYSISDQFQGNLTFNYVTYYGSNSVILIPNRTDNGKLWDYATIFYDPKTLTYPNGIPIEPSACGYTFQTFINQYTVGGHKISHYCFGVVNTLVTNTTVNAISYELSGYIGNPPFANTTALVILANKTIHGVYLNGYPASYAPASTANFTNFNLTFQPDSWNQFVIETNMANYAFHNKGIGGGSLVSAPQQEDNANYTFNGIYAYDGYGFEAWMKGIGGGNGWTSAIGQIGFQPFNEIRTEAIGVNEPIFFNSSSWIGTNTPLSTGLAIQSFENPNLVDFKIKTNASIRIILLPAFTRNTIFYNYQSNSSISNICPIDNKGWACDFQAERNLTVTWSYNYSTQAYSANNFGNSAIPLKNNTYPFGAGMVGYAWKNITWEQGMGNNCQYIFIANVLNKDAIPFYSECHAPNYIKLLLQNTTLHDYPYTEATLFYGSPSGQGYFSNTMVYKNWLISPNMTGAYSINALGEDNARPYLIQLSQSFNLNSRIGIGNLLASPYTAMGLTTYNGIVKNYVSYDYNCCGQSGVFYSPPTSYTLILANASTTLEFTNLVNPWESVDAQQGGGFIGNTMTYKVLGYPANPIPHYNPVNVLLTGGLTAEAYQLYTNQINVSPIYYKPNYNITWNSTIPTTIIPTYNYSAISQIYFGVNLPKFIIVIIALFITILSAMMLNTAEVTGGALGLTIVFIFGLFTFGYAVVILGLLMLVLFIIYEYNKGRHHGRD